MKDGTVLMLTERVINMKIIKHVNRWTIELDNGKHLGRFKTKREALAQLNIELVESLLTPEQKEIRDLKEELAEALKSISKLEQDLEESEIEVRALEDKVSDLEGERNITDEEEEVIYLVDALKIAQERFNLGVVSEADTIRELHEKLVELKVS